MALTLVPFPAAAPTAITDWEKAIDIMEFNTLGIHGASLFDFSSNTIKQGVRIMIGGSVYLADADTAITGTPSDYVKITPAGATASATYVSSLTGVSWNSVWDFWEDGSGNAYLFNEMKNYAGGGSAPRSALAQHYSYGAYDALTTLGDTILARDSGQVLVGEDSVLKSGSKMEIVGGTYTLLLTDNTTDASPKVSRLVSAHYTNSEQPLALIYGSSTSIGNVISVGGGFSTVNSATAILFYTAANNTTVTGTEAGRITSNQNSLWGTIIDSGPRIVVADGAGTLPTIAGDTVALFQGNSTTTQSAFISIIAGNSAFSGIKFGDQDDENIGLLQYIHSDNSMRFVTNTSEAARFTSAHHLLVNGTSDLACLTVTNDGSSNIVRAVGTLGSVIISNEGNVLNFTRAGANYIQASGSGGSLNFWVNGTNIALACNADQSVTVNTTLNVDTIAEKTASAGVSFNNTIKVDTISEKTASAGVTFTNSLIVNNGAADGANIEFMSSGYETAKMDNYYGSYRIFSDTYGDVATFDTNSSSKTVTFKGAVIVDSISSSGSWTVTTTAYVIPAGLYNISYGTILSSTQIEIYVSGSWRIMSKAQTAGGSAYGSAGDFVISDGVNVRIRATSGTETVYWQKY